MINFRENSAQIFNHIYGGLICLGLLIIGGSKLYAWGGFGKPIDVHFHVQHEQEKDPEQELQEMMEAADQERESSNDQE